MKHPISSIALLIVLFFSACKSEKEKAIQGFWTDGTSVIAIDADTLVFYPSMSKSLISLVGDNIYITKHLNDITFWVDFKEFKPRLFGSIRPGENGYVIWVDDRIQVTKFEPIDHPRKLGKVQFSSIGWSCGFNLEVDTLGNAIISMDGYCDNYSSYSFKVPKEDVHSILSRYSYVQIDSLKPSYKQDNCYDCGGGMFSFFFEDDTVNCYIYGDAEHYSLALLRGFIDRKALQYARDTTSYQRVENHFFYSRLLECEGRMDCQIDYYSRFDSINYVRPHYDLSLLKKIVDKYYDFKDTRIRVDVTTDSTGKIVDFVVENSAIETRKGFLAEVQRKLSAKPAVFNRKKIGMKDNILLDYNELKE